MSNSAFMPKASRAIPARVTAPPTQMRCRNPVGVILAWSLRAATGGMLRTLRAGPRDDSTVAPIPTTAATTTVLNRIGMPPGRFPKLIATRTQRRNVASR